METDDIIDVAVNTAKEKVKDVQKIEAGKFVLYEKKEPWYNSTVLSVPVKYVLAGVVIYSIIKK